MLELRAKDKVIVDLAVRNNDVLRYRISHWLVSAR